MWALNPSPEGKRLCRPLPFPTEKHNGYATNADGARYPEMTRIVSPSPVDSMAAWNRFITDYVRSGLPDLTNRQMAIFLRVAMQTGPHTVRGLAAALNLSKPVITRALNKLSELGYLRRQRDLTDRRNVIIAPTDKGAQFLEHIGTLGRPEQGGRQ